MEKSADPSNPPPPAPAPDAPEAKAEGEAEAAVTAERLLKVLEIQMATQRARPAGLRPGLPLTSFRYWGLVVIVLFTFISIAAMEYILSRIPRPHHPAALSSPAPATP